MTDLQIACTLTARELDERRVGLLSEIAGAARERRDLYAGHAFRFAPSSRNTDRSGWR